MALNKDGFEAGSILTLAQQVELDQRKRDEARNVSSKPAAKKRSRKTRVDTAGEQPATSEQEAEASDN